MKWWQIRKNDADLERELRSDLELGEEEQLANSLSPEEGSLPLRAQAICLLAASANPI